LLQTIICTQAGTLAIQPEPIQAEDMDTLDYRIQYSLAEGTEGYEGYFAIDPGNGEVRQIQAINRQEFREMKITVMVRQLYFIYGQCTQCM